MTEKKKDRRSLGEEWRLIRRAIGILNRLMPHYWLYETACMLTETFSLYFGLWMSAGLVDELAGACDSERLFLLAGIAVAGGFLLSLTAKLLRSRRELCEEHFFNRHEAWLADAQNCFKYEYLEDPEVILRRSKILAGVTATGNGLLMVRLMIGYLMRNVLEIIFSAALTVSMFTMRARGELQGVSALVNSPALAGIVLLLIMAGAFGSVRISAAGAVRMRKALSTLAWSNTRYSAFCRLWGADMVIFGLNRIVLKEAFQRRFLFRWIRDAEKVSVECNTWMALLNAAMDMIIFLFVAAKAYIGVFGIGSFILYQGAVRRFIVSVSGIAGNYSHLRENNNDLASLYDYVDLPNNMYRGSLAVEKRDDIDYEIEFRDVSFRYPRTENWALRHVSMKFKIGDKLAIVGENGSGKTTFIKLLCRLYDPTEGKILLNGIDISRYRHEEYMALFSVVFQDYSVFGFSLGENVALSLEYDRKRVRDCLVRAGLGEKLDRLEKDAGEKDVLDLAIGRQYDSQGIDLSGGELQKTALARALYKDAPFVVLDEPTAALDPKAEAEVYENFNRLAEGKTAVFISHRLSSCRFCDSIAVFDGGRLIQQGSHGQLAADAEGKYSQLWHAQAQYYEK